MSSDATNPVDPRVREKAALPAAVKSRMQEPIRAVRHVITLPVFDPVQPESFA